RGLTGVTKRAKVDEPAIRQRFVGKGRGAISPVNGRRLVWIHGQNRGKRLQPVCHGIPYGSKRATLEAARETLQMEIVVAPIASQRLIAEDAVCPDRTD